MFAFENLLACIPMFILCWKIMERKIYLDGIYGQLPEEELSMNICLCLTFLCPLVFLAVPFLQFWILKLYHLNYHPWSAIINPNIR